MSQHPKLSHSELKIFYILLAAALVATLIFVFWPKTTASQVAPRTAFAECLASKGVVMYGSDTCDNCQLQKGMFEEDFQKINYVNCDIHQDVCNKMGIQGYPTWDYNGQRLVGLQVFQKLAALTSCQAPQ